MRIDDDARQTRGVEHALLEVEFPASVLLRHEPPLQAVREPRHDRRQILQLLVEILAQALKLLRLAQVVGVDDLVETSRVGLVFRSAPLLRMLLRRSVLGCFVGVTRFAFVLELRRRRLDRVHRAFIGVVGRVVRRLALHRVLRLLLLAFALGLVGVLGRLVLLVFVALLGIGVQFVREPERSEELVDQPGVGALVEDGVAELVQIAAGFLLDERTPKLGQALSAGRGFLTRHPLAGEHGDGVLERRFFPRARLGERTAVIPVVEHGAEVRGDALHSPRADRLDPSLLDGVEQGARRRDSAGRAGGGSRRCGRRASKRTSPPGRE